MILVDKAERPVASLLLAHGAGAGMHSDFMQQMALRLSQLDIDVYRFNFPYMQQAELAGKKRPPNTMPVLQDSLREALDSVPTTLPRFIGGKSMGGRVASMLVDDLAVSGCLCLGYPFHPPGKPDKLRITHLQKPGKAVVILQGQRDTFGREAEVAAYSLHPRVSVQFVMDGDHSFAPRKASGLTLNDNIQFASEKMADFIGAHI